MEKTIETLAVAETEIKLIVNLPFFPGFYESSLSQTLDLAEEREAENIAGNECSEEYYPKSYQPEQLQIDAQEYCGILMDTMNYRAAHLDMAQDYCSAFDNWMNENLQTPVGSFVFESMDSPREYNFSTDRVYCYVPESVMQKLLDDCDIAKLEESIKDRFTSYDGFSSFYSNDISDWQFKPISDLDHNELATILCAAIQPYVEDSRDWQHDLVSGIYENDYEYVDRHNDWLKFTIKTAELRAEKLAKWISDDPQGAAIYIARCGEALDILPLALVDLDAADRQQWEAAAGVVAARFYRCLFTIDMFGENGK